jgi:hypothetical protein
MGILAPFGTWMGRGPRAVSAEVPLGGECYRLERLIPQLGLNHQ